MTRTAIIKLRKDTPILIGQPLHGLIFSDSKKRFSDKEFVKTSAVAFIEAEDKVITESGTEYKIDWIEIKEWNTYFG